MKKNLEKTIILRRNGNDNGWWSQLCKRGEEDGGRMFTERLCGVNRTTVVIRSIITTSCSSSKGRDTQADTDG